MLSRSSGFLFSFPELKEEDVKAADRRREKYSHTRDLLAKENNDAIALRLARDKDKEGQV